MTPPIRANPTLVEPHNSSRTSALRESSMREEQKPVISHPTEFEHGLDAASVRVMLAAALSNRDVQIEEVLRLLEQTSDEIRFNRELVKASLEHLSLGVSVVDKNLRLVAWNRRYVEFFDYPESLITAGCPIEEIQDHFCGIS